MRLSSRAIFCTLAVLAPLTASAVGVAVNLGNVIGIVQSNKKPLAFELGMKGTMGKASGSATVKGTHNGNLTSLAKAALEATITLDAKADANSWGHAEFKTRLVKETLYIRLEDFSAEGPWAAYINDVKPFMDVWYRFPVDAAEYDRFMKDQQKNRNASYKQIESLFEIVREELQGGRTRYTLSIPKNRQRRLLSRILGPSYARSYRNASVDARLSVETVANVFDLFTGSLDLSATVEGQKSTMKISGKANVLKTAPVIAAPAESSSWEEFVEEYYESQTGSTTTLPDARNAQRRSDVNTILNAVYQYAIDNAGTLPPGITGSPREICTTGHDDCGGLSLDILTGSYLVRIPRDPSFDSTSPVSGYTIVRDANARITVSAPLAEGGQEISVTR